MRRAPLALLALWACTGGNTRTPSRDGGAPDVRPIATPSLSPSTEPDAAFVPADRAPLTATDLQVMAMDGTVSGIALDAAVDADRRVRLGPADAVTLSLGDYVRLRVLGPGTLQLAPEGAAALLLREGTVVVDVAPRGARAGERAIWIGTPGGLLEVAHAARFVVHAHADGASTVSVVSGNLRLSQGEEDTMLVADDARCLAPGSVRHLPLVVGNLEARTARLRQAPSCAGRSPGDVAKQDAALAAKLDALAAKKALAARLVAEHARAVSAHADAAPLQAALAREAAAVERLSAQVRAARVGVDARLADDEGARALRARARALAPYR